MAREHVVIIGGGFGGLAAAKILKDGNCDITIIDQANHHLFQPLLYQVATAALSPADIAQPIREIFGKDPNISVIMDKVISIDRVARKVILTGRKMSFDKLIIAIGSSHSYFGHDEWAEYATGMKTVEDALKIRENILLSLETAEEMNDAIASKKYLTFVIIGGGPTGVEMAGAIAEIAKESMLKDFRNIDANMTKVYLIEGAERLLSTYPVSLSERAKEDLTNMGVEVILNRTVTDISAVGVKIGDQLIETANIIWAAGNKISPLLKTLDTELDKTGRVIVGPSLSIPDDPNIFVIGDAAAVKWKEGKFIPGVAAAATQEGKYVARLILSGNDPSDRAPFKYFDRGSMATIGRAKAVADIRGFKVKGLFAWLLWSLVHVFLLIGFRNRFRVMAEWMWYYISFKHGSRLITHRHFK